MSTYSDGENSVGEMGGFLQVSGLKYTIDTTVKSSAKGDDKSMFVSVDGAYRVKNVKVLKNGKYVDIDPKATYTVASHNYMLKDSGDGINMFADNKLLQDSVMLDNQVPDQLHQGQPGRHRSRNLCCSAGPHHGHCHPVHRRARRQLGG